MPSPRRFPPTNGLNALAAVVSPTIRGTAAAYGAAFKGVMLKMPGGISVPGREIGWIFLSIASQWRALFSSFLNIDLSSRSNGARVLPRRVRRRTIRTYHFRKPLRGGFWPRRVTAGSDVRRTAQPGVNNSGSPLDFGWRLAGIIAITTSS
jgi:hypothetical protein